MKLSFLFIILFSPLSFAGVMNGGGGKGVLCPSSIEVLDLYESKAVYGLTEAPRKADFRSEVLLGMESLDEVWRTPEEPNHASTNVDSIIQEFFKKVTYIPAGQRLPVTNDATIPPLPKDCKIIQIVLYEDGKGISIDKEYWDHLDYRNQVAILFHEELYFYRRTYGAVDSDETRRFVGWLLSTTPPEKRFGDKPLTGFYDCRAGLTGTPIFDFYIYPALQGGKQGYVMSFRQFVTATTLGRTTAFFEDAATFNALRLPSAKVSLKLSVSSQTRQENRWIVLEKQAGESYGKLWVEDPTSGSVSPAAPAICDFK